MYESLAHHEVTEHIGGRVITNLKFADDIDGLVGMESELGDLIYVIDHTSRAYSLEVKVMKTQILKVNSHLK